jgi:hypothetical protein
MMRNHPPHTFLQNHVSMKLVEVSLSCLHFSLMFSEGEIKSPYFLQVWWALGSLYFYILLLLMPVSSSVLLLYASAHKISLKYLFPEKMFIEVCCQKCQKCNAICVTTFFYIFKGLWKKKIKYIHQHLRYYETIEQIHFMVVKIESCVWEKNCNIWSSLIPLPPSSKTTKE